MKKVLLFLSAVVLTYTPSAEAAPIYYYNDIVASRAAFQAAAGSLTLQSFEIQASGTAIDFGDVLVTSNGSMLTGTAGVPSRTVTDGSFGLLGSEVGGRTYTFTFDSPITAFGIDVLDLSFQSVSFSDSLGNTLPFALLADFGGPQGGPGFQNMQFFGVTNVTPFTSVTFTMTPGTTGGTVAFDRLEYAAAAPEPASMLLLGTALLGAGVRRWRQKRG